MDTPMFLGATQGDVAGDEPVDPNAPAQPLQTGDVTNPEDVDDETGHGDGGGRQPTKKGKARSRSWY